MLSHRYFYDFFYEKLSYRHKISKNVQKNVDNCYFRFFKLLNVNAKLTEMKISQSDK